MFRKFIFTSLFFVASLSARAELPSNYTQLSAEAKLSVLWNQIEASRWATLPAYNDSGWSSIITSLRSAFTLYKTFDNKSDEIPSGREKLIHAFGTVAQVAFIPIQSDSHYTGIYETGAIGLARMSLAANPDSASFTPAMAIKFLVDGNDSVNLQVMNDLEGQGDDWNFFARNFSNSIPEPTSTLLKIGAYIFSFVQNPPNFLPVYHLSEIDRFGQNNSSPTTPTQLVFRPSIDIQKLYPIGVKMDPRLFLETLTYGSILYDVFSIEAEQEVLIGQLRLISKFVASEYGDHTLFFQHQRFKK